jgi:hypothetical protein
MKQFLTLEGDYAGKQVRRLKKFGRIELLRVFHDPDEIIQEPYWFVRIAGFDEKRDQDRAPGVRTGAAGAMAIGGSVTWNWPKPSLTSWPLTLNRSRKRLKPKIYAVKKGKHFRQGCETGKWGWLKRQRNQRPLRNPLASLSRQASHNENHHRNRL